MTARLRLAASFVAILTLAAPSRGDDSTYVKLLKSPRVAEDKMATIVAMIGTRGTAADLAYVFERSSSPGGFPEPVRLKALAALESAARTRDGLRPAGDLSTLGNLIRPGGDKESADLRLAAVRLAGAWKLAAARQDLLAIAAAPGSDRTLRAAAFDALTAAVGEGAKADLAKLDAAGAPKGVRAAAVAALARLDPADAANRAAALLADAPDPADIPPLIAAFLDRQGGADALATAIGTRGLAVDPAKQALRAVYALGRADESLIKTLLNAAKLDAEVKPLTTTEVQGLVAEVASAGDPARGEAVFRRKDLSCTQCHALVGAGGGVGPELTAVGAVSPVDYLINSVLLPDQAIKEEYRTLIILTHDGRISQGIVADRDDSRIILKDAAGERRTIATADIEESKEGGSLMPKGLVNLMTHAEFVDLLRFLSELGKPGAYAIRPTPTIQRLRVLTKGPDGVPDELTLADKVLAAPSLVPAYAKASGALPLDELAASASPDLYLVGEVDVSAAGEIAFRPDSPAGLLAWFDGKPVPVGESIAVAAEKGRHTLALRVDLAERKSRSLKVEVAKAAGSEAEFSVVGGR